ncbi:hypothetical protein MLD38_010684 [Melastoma candidum]|uniref:Uncharacterized protein n=1 Tax=Melastoma candidum TaxID=119954 RepID=A0ACB9R1R1_9MYRT|nr:hypothetical protein MLD38_010684 [Melastoma candidum]
MDSLVPTGPSKLNSRAPFIASYDLFEFPIADALSSDARTYSVHVSWLQGLQGTLRRLVDCLPCSSDNKTLKRWFFIDKRAG